MIFNIDDEPIADGWMDFLYVKETDQLIVYWEYLDIFVDDDRIAAKTESGIPQHLSDF